MVPKIGQKSQTSFQIKLVNSVVKGFFIIIDGLIIYLQIFWDRNGLMKKIKWLYKPIICK